MNMIVFNTLAGAPLAMLALSTPVQPQRDCVFVRHPQITSETFTSKEGQVVLPDRPTEYPCAYQQSRTGTDITFTNQNGWRFVVRIPRHDAGSWLATKDADTVSGSAFAPYDD